MNIRIYKKEDFLKILKKRKGSKFEKTLFNYSNKQSKLPSDFPKTALANDLRLNNVIRQDVFTGIIHLVLEDYKNYSTNNTHFKYTLEDFQRIFTHFRKEDLKNLSEETRKQYNLLIEELTKDNKPFKDISINENWEISGGKCADLKILDTPKKSGRLKKIFVSILIITPCIFLFVFLFKYCTSDKKPEQKQIEFSKDSVNNHKKLDTLKIKKDSFPKEKNNMIINIQVKDSGKINQINNFNNVKEVNL